MEATLPLETRKKWRTIYEEEEGEFLDGVICIGNVSLHLEPQLCVITRNIQQFPGQWKKAVDKNVK